MNSERISAMRSLSFAASSGLRLSSATILFGVPSVASELTSCVCVFCDSILSECPFSISRPGLLNSQAFELQLGFSAVENQCADLAFRSVLLGDFHASAFQ